MLPSLLTGLSLAAISAHPLEACTYFEGAPQDPGLFRAGFYGHPGFEVAGLIRYPHLDLDMYVSYSARRYDRPPQFPPQAYRPPQAVIFVNRSTGEVFLVLNPLVNHRSTSEP